VGGELPDVDRFNELPLLIRVGLPPAQAIYGLDGVERRHDVAWITASCDYAANAPSRLATALATWAASAA